jgi:hypothetical protein
MPMQRQATTALAALIVLVAIATSRPADGQVPTATDRAACSHEAGRGMKLGKASPTPNDRARADRAREGAASGTLDATAGMVESADPPIHGVESEGAKRAAYQSAYRGCMRRKGF